MIRAEQIPDEAVKAALLTDDQLGMREVIAAAINAWPGMGTVATEDHAGVWRQIILPLPQEESGE